MTEFLLETYMAAQESLPEIEARVHEAAAELTARGEAVRYLGGTFVPADELCWHLLESATRGAVAAAARRAGISPLRIVEAARTGQGDNANATREA